MRGTRRLALALLVLLVAGCDGGGGDPFDAGPRVDAGATLDAGRSDAGGALDAGAPVDDAGAPSDAGPVTPLGVISGACGELDDTELLGAGPFYFAGNIDFATAPTMADVMRLSTGAQEIITEGTVGGSSDYSEAISFEVLARCEGATLLKSESEIVYTDPMGTKTDYLADIDGHRVGVSVVRAVGFPREDPYPVARAESLLMDKLTDILASSANVSAADAWVKQILHVIAYAPMHAASIMTAWDNLDAGVRADTVLWVTVTDGEDAFIYDNMLSGG